MVQNDPRRLNMSAINTKWWLAHVQKKWIADGWTLTKTVANPFSGPIFTPGCILTVCRTASVVSAFVGHPFFYFEGVYYDQGAAGYVIVAPPLGAVVSELPPGAETVVLGDTVYYYAGGAFYVQQPDGSFVVVAQPIGVTVTMLPPDAISVLINGIVHYQADSAYYLPVMQNGVTAYLTVHLP